MIAQLIYGVLTRNNCHIDISSSERGAKQMATARGYKVVSARNVYTGCVYIVARKVNGRWKAEK